MTDDATRAAAERLVGHAAARTDGDDPYRPATPHDPSQSYLFDHDQFRADIGVVGRAYLAEHPADDAEPVTAEWLASVGWGVTVTRTVVAYESGDLRVSGQLHDGVWHLFGRRVEGDCSLRCRTRGDVRRLLAALGVA